MIAHATRLLCIVGALSATACGTNADSHGVGSVSGDPEGPLGPDDREAPALFEGLTVALTVRGPADRDLVAAVSGSAEVAATVVEVTLGSVPAAATVDENGVATFYDLFQLSPPPATARVRFYDALGRYSAVSEVPIAPRIIRAAGEACDENELADRCADGLGCKGQPALCGTSEPPAMSQISYQPGTSGARLLIRGTDVDDDIDVVDLAFYGANGDSVLVDLDGDDEPESAGFAVDAARASSGGAFFVDIGMAEGFDEIVKSLDVTMRDRAGNTSTTQHVELTAPPVRTVGSACDVDGFDTCVAGAVCSAVADRTLCRLQNARQSEVCGALVPVAFAGEAVDIAGAIEPTGSVFATPDGCALGAPRERPEAVIAVDVAAPTDSLTITTNVPGTACDTVVSVFSSCGATAPLGCSDDDGNSMNSTVVLHDVQPGTYFVVVESWNVSGGAFALELR